MDNRTHAQKRRAESQDAMREFLRGRGLLEQIHNDLDREIPAEELQQIKFKTETRLKLLAKLLPDLSESKTEIETGESLTALLVRLGSGRSNPPVA